jgi:hypothetical protein
MYNEYKVTLSSDPSVYGHNVSQEQTNEINHQLSSIIVSEFPGIQIEISHLDGCGKTTGPDQDAIDEINSWISENWTAAL